MNTDNKIREAFEVWFWEEVIDNSFCDKKHLFEKHEVDSIYLYSVEHVNDAWQGYQAAHAASEKRIALLEGLANKLVKETELDDKEIETLHSKNEALQADNKRLLDALQLAHNHLDIEALKISHCKDCAAIKQAINNIEEI